MNSIPVRDSTRAYRVGIGAVSNGEEMARLAQKQYKFKSLGKMLYKETSEELSTNLFSLNEIKGFRSKNSLKVIDAIYTLGKSRKIYQLKHCDKNNQEVSIIPRVVQIIEFVLCVATMFQPIHSSTFFRHLIYKERKGGLFSNRWQAEKR